MATIGQQFTFLRSPHDMVGQAAADRARTKQAELAEEGHASSVTVDPASGSVLLTVLPGRPDGWAEVYGDESETSPAARRHFGLDSACVASAHFRDPDGWLRCPTDQRQMTRHAAPARVCPFCGSHFNPDRGSAVVHVRACARRHGTTWPG
jgi:hypothetical protein